MKMAGLLMDEAMKRLAEPRDDFLTHLVQAEIEGRPIAPDEVVNFLLGASIAGHETTMNAAGNLCYELAIDAALQERVPSGPVADRCAGRRDAAPTGTGPELLPRGHT